MYKEKHFHLTRDEIIKDKKALKLIKDCLMRYQSQSDHMFSLQLNKHLKL